MTEEFKLGDQVKLKSGGPIMTVVELEDPILRSFGEGVKCVWFYRDKLMERCFDRAALEVVGADSKDT